MAHRANLRGMTGMDRHTGRALSGTAHLRQSIADILTTPIGSRVMRPTYGSRIFELVDSPLTPSRKMEIASAVADALALWEPRISVISCQLVRMDSHRPVFSVYATVVADGTAILTEVTA